MYTYHGPCQPDLTEQEHSRAETVRNTQEIQETYADTPAVQPATSITHLSPQPAGTGNIIAQGSRKRQTSRKEQESQESFRPSKRQNVTDKQSCCNSHWEWHLCCRHTTPTTSTRMSKSVTSPQTTQKKANTRLRANKMTDTFLSTTPLAQCYDAQQIPSLLASNENSTHLTQPPDSLCLSYQKSIALSRTRRRA